MRRVSARKRRAKSGTTASGPSKIARFSPPPEALLMRLIPTCAALAALTLGGTLATSVLAAEPAMDEAARMQYALGYQLGRDLVAIEPRPQDMLKGLEDGRSGKAKLSEEEMRAALAALQQKVGAQREKDRLRPARRRPQAARPTSPRTPRSPA